MKKALRETQTLCAGCSKAEQKIFTHTPTNTQTDKQTNKQTNKQTHRQYRLQYTALLSLA